MQSRLPSHRLAGTPFRSRISALMLAMFATMASIYVAGRLWQDAKSRVYLIQELDKRTGQGQSAISVDDTLKVIACREQQKKLSALEMELAAAKKDGFVSKYLTGNGDSNMKKKLLAVIGITTQFGRRRNRDAIRKAWMPSGAALEKLEDHKGIVVRFVIGRSANHGDSLDREIDAESRQTNDFIIIDDHVEAPEEQPKKTKFFIAHAAETWDAEFYGKVNDDVFVNIDGLGAILSSYLDKPLVYIGCMKSGEVFSEPGHKWYEPDWWKFGDGKSIYSSVTAVVMALLRQLYSGIGSPLYVNGVFDLAIYISGECGASTRHRYFQHASGEIFVISQALAQFVSINRSMLRTYAHDDISAGSWFIGLDVKHVNEAKLCCSSWSSGAICAAV